MLGGSGSDEGARAAAARASRRAHERTRSETSAVERMTGLRARRSTPISTSCASSADCRPPRSARMTATCRDLPPSSSGGEYGDWASDPRAGARLPGRAGPAAARPPTGHPSAQGRVDPRVLPLLLRRGTDRARRGRPARPAAAAAPAARHARPRRRSKPCSRRPTRQLPKACATARCWSSCTRAGCASARRCDLTSMTCRCARRPSG